MRGNTITIELPLKRGKVSKTIPLYQYDYGQKLIITDVELPSYYEVHFSNEMHGDAVTSIGDSTGVEIPDSLLATGENVYLWLYLHDSDSDGETEFQGAIPVIKRAKVTDQTPTPHEQSVIEQAINALNGVVETAVEEATEAAIAASQAAQEAAEEAAQDAEAARDAAQAAAGDFQGISADAVQLESDEDPTIAVNHSQGGLYHFSFGIPKGVDGTDGTDGTDGVTFTPSVSSEGVISWTNDGSRTNPESVNIKGPKGDTGDPAPSSAVVPAVEDWLDENVAQETGYVLDRSLQASNAAAPADLVGDLKNDLNATEIVEATGEQYNHSLNNPKELVFVGNSMAFRTAKYADKENFYPDQSYNDTKNGVTYTGSGCLWELNGVSTGSSTYNASYKDYDPPIPAGNYTMYAEVDVGDSVLGANGVQFGMLVIYSDDTSEQKNTYVLNVDRTWSFTFSKPIKRILAYAGNISGYTFDNYRVWFGLYDSAVTFVDTNETVGIGEEYSISLSDKNLSVINSCQHKSYVTSIANTKQYVDTKVADSIKYVSPEDFGAIGDGVNDDTQALIACVAASESNSTPMRGYRHYKTSSPIEFSGVLSDVYINEIKYTGNDAAVILHGIENRYRFGSIIATTQNTAVGIRITCLDGMNFNLNVVECADLRSGSHTVEFINQTTSNTIYYNTLRFQNQTSLYGDVFHNACERRFNENDIYGKYAKAANGYFFYGKSNERLRLYNFSIEEVKYGLNGNAYLYDIRTDEFMGRLNKDGDARQGAVFYFDSDSVATDIYVDARTNLLYTSINVDNLPSYSERIAYLEETLTLDTPSSEVFRLLFYNLCTPYLRFESIGRADLNAPITSRPSMSMLVYYNHKCIQMKEEWYYTISSAEFTAGLNGHDYISPSFFDINYSLSEIHLDDSYCYLGINNFKVKQYSDKKAKVYDKFGNVIFDGSTKEAGVYEFECEFVRHSPITLNLVGGGTINVISEIVNSIYDGTNEVWQIYKKDIVA